MCGTFYFYFPDKETLFVHLYEETADFLLQTIGQSLNSRATMPKQYQTALNAYVNIAVYEPAIIQLLLIGGVGAVPALEEKRAAFRERLTQVWQRPLLQALDKNQIAAQNDRRTAEALTGAFDEVILNLLKQPDPGEDASNTVHDMTQFAIRATAYRGE